MNILDATVRDGSYAIDFKFSCKDVRDLVSRAERIGLKYIEVGHGQGLNASSHEHGIALQTDVEYMRAAKEVVKEAKLGFFCIPGIARLEDITTAKENGIDFLRMGVNAQEYPKVKPYVEKAKAEGLQVFVNFMKSYTVTPEELAEAAVTVQGWGAECVYIVDSAGCMTSQEIGQYIDAIRSKCDVAIGFHGHNNLGLAVENTVYCYERGIEFIDCSFQGLGRSAGNASLEQVIMVLDKKGYDLGFDIPKVLEYGYAGLRHIAGDRLLNPLDYICGYAGFHSGFLKSIYRCSMEKNVDPLRLILAYSKRNRTSMNYEELCAVADTLPVDPDDNPYPFRAYFSEIYNES
ncbi:MAG: 4-hydroxy-2-oxovalerate aldolase [Ruminococcaceae bacterium]|nr:4-hydroxy-2-oxovalerate aldolase [Oscillospiraceae bacterium]